jgi:predicted O-methyltransferase YrrM
MYFLPPPLSRRLWRIRAKATLRRLGFSSSELKRLFSELETDLHPALRQAYGTIQSASAERPTGEMPFNITVEVLYVLARATKPAVIVETGVAAGISSTAWLTAISKNGSGRLFSIDLPKHSEGDDTPGSTFIPEGHESGWAIPDELRESHDLRIGSSLALLADLVASLGSIDVFFHDSDHSEDNVRFELETAWPTLSAGGLLVSHDVHKHDAFSTFADRQGAAQGKISILGVARRPSG